IEPFNLAEELSRLPEVEYAEPWFIYPINDVTSCRSNDQFRSYQWGLDKILADTAWCIEQGDTNVVIGIIDTGVQLDHPDLQPNIWINQGEYGPDGHGGDKQSNCIDDDGNSFIDDWHGCDFGGSDYKNPIEDNNPAPVNSTSSHGTHVAGIASAATNNSVGVAGVGYKCKILPVKTSSDNDTRGGGYPYIVYGFEGILYAATMGATVINGSWGGDGASQFEQDPASYDGVISVAATNSSDIKPGYSAYNGYVDVSAPGDNIYSTIYPSGYVSSTGTSMSTSFVTGLAALVKSHFPSYNNLQIGEQVRVSCDNINSLNPSYVDLLGKGRINALNALTMVSPSLRMISFTTSDSAGGNNNGILQPNETFSIFASFTNYLSPTNAGAAITLTSSDSYVQIVSGSYPIGVVGTLETVENSSSPFQVLIKSTMPPSHDVVFKLTMNDGSYSDYQFFSVLINPTFATHNINNVEVSLTNIGRIGYLDLNNVSGSGFIFGGDNQLYEGGLIIGYSSEKLIDVVRDDTCNICQDNDFSSTQIYDMVYPGMCLVLQ
ncbi:MAG: S8 family serine peptidase, partial [Ignavibacteriales bacterium]|nr:S8 family serine peptidase [Ignavibacteriales bacterium]